MGDADFQRPQGGDFRPNGRLEARVDYIEQRQVEDRAYAREIARHGRDTANAVVEVVREVKAIKEDQKEDRTKRDRARELAWRVFLVVLAAAVAYGFGVLQNGGPGA